MIEDCCRAHDPETGGYYNDSMHIIETELDSMKVNCLFCGVWFIKTPDGDWVRL